MRDNGHVQTASKNLDFLHIQILSKCDFKSLDSKKTLKSNLIQTTYRGGLRCNSNHIFSDASQSGNAQIDVKTVDGNARNIHTVFKLYIQRFQHFLYLFGEWDFPPFFLNPFWKLCNILVWTYSTPVPKQPMQMVLSGHTNLIWSLMTAWKEKKIWFVCSLSEHSLPYCDCTASLHHCVPDSWISSSTLCLDICPVIMIFSIIWWITAAMLTWKM